MGIPVLQSRQNGQPQRDTRSLLRLPQGSGKRGLCVHVGSHEERPLGRRNCNDIRRCPMKLLTAAVAALSLMASAAGAQAQEAKMKDDLRRVAPALENYTQDRLLGEVWKRPELSARDRSVVTVAALIARNQTIELPFYLNLALDNGVKPKEISEIITHLA